jgi:hypothetical protein
MNLTKAGCEIVQNSSELYMIVGDYIIQSSCACIIGDQIVTGGCEAYPGSSYAGASLQVNRPGVVNGQWVWSCRAFQEGAAAPARTTIVCKHRKSFDRI